MPLYAGIELRLTTIDGAPLSQAAVGEPFLIEVTIPDTKSTNAPKIEGVDSFNIRNAGIQIRSINGNSSVKHLYKVRIDIPGDDYLIGPATLYLDGDYLRSNTVELTVAERQVAQGGSNKRRQHALPVLLILKLDKKEAFIGEKIKAFVQFLYSDNTISLERIIEPELNDFVIASKTGPVTGMRTFDRTEYNVLEWCFELYPKCSGDITIPAYCADFLVQSRRDKFTAVSFFFGQRSIRKSIYSNAVRISISPLPEHDPPISAIGAFNTFSAKIDPSVAKESEGMVFSLILSGEGNFDSINIPELQGIPPVFKYYDSKNYCMDTTGDGNPAKCFEYIVQGFESGNWEIPAQKFTYFNIKSKSYKTLKTMPLYITIMPQNTSHLKSSNLTKPDQQNQQDDKHVQKNKDDLEGNDNLRLLNKDGAWYRRDNYPMAWYWFFLLFILPFLCLLIYSIKHAMAYFNIRYASSLRRKRAFIIAGKQLKAASAANDIVQLYHLFVDLFAVRLQLPATSILQVYIEQKLSERSWSVDQITAFSRFFSTLTELVYGVQKQRGVEKELFEQARRWLNRLKKVI